MIQKTLKIAAKKEFITTPHLINQQELLNVDPLHMEKLALQNSSSTHYPYHHFVAGPLYEHFYQENPELVPILMIRDIRDVCVAQTFDKWERIGDRIGHLAPFSLRLLFYMKNTRIFEEHDLLLNCQNALPWLDNPSAVLCRFEDLVGPKGGGTQKRQDRVLEKIANTLQIPLTQHKVSQIHNHLFGTTATFRSGKIGSWKVHFTPKTKKVFKEIFGDLLIAFGYEKNNDW